MEKIKVPYKGSRALTIAALMAAAANVLSFPPFAIPLAIGSFESAIHFSQLPIFLSGVLAGPVMGALTGAVGGIYMTATKIPFIIAGLAILGLACGFLSRRMNPLFSGIVAWCIQVPYVFVSDYIWFTYFLHMPQSAAIGIVITLIVKLTIEAVVCSILLHTIVNYLKRVKVALF